MIEILETTKFSRWMRRLGDPSARLRIVSRIVQLSQGHAGDIKALGQGLLEMRINYGPGYRIYLIRKNDRMILLLAGGIKKAQAADIREAMKQARRIRSGNG